MRTAIVFEQLDDDGINSMCWYSRFHYEDSIVPDSCDTGDGLLQTCMVMNLTLDGVAEGKTWVKVVLKVVCGDDYSWYRPQQLLMMSSGLVIKRWF